MKQPVITTFAQNREDLILQAFFVDESKGAYVDIDPLHPIKNSTTKLFYGKGWRGVNVVTSEQALQLFMFDRQNDNNARVLPQQKVNVKELLNEQKIAQVNFVHVSGSPLAATILHDNFRALEPRMVCIEKAALLPNIAELLKQTNYSLVFSDGLNDYFLAKKAMHLAQPFDYKKLINSGVILPLREKQLLDLYQQQKHLDEQHVARLNTQKEKAEKQSSWYEQAPLSWMLRKTAYSFAGAINARMTAESVDIANYSLRSTNIAKKPTRSDALALAQSYQKSVHYTTVAPSKAQKVILYAPWMLLRVARKALRTVKARG